jgi:folylpolyglutamate synthase/dihydropteroate synthase
MRLYKVEEAFKVIKEFGSRKLRDLVTESENITTKSDTSDTSTVEQGNNIAVTLDHLLKENSDLKDPKSMLLICGTFFIMSDVKQYFGQHQEIDII